MESSTDYCTALSATNTFSKTSYGAKFASCKVSPACPTDFIFIVKNDYGIKSIDFEAKGWCVYTIYYVMIDPDTVFEARDWPLDSSVNSGSSSSNRG